jgi:hypothetical protein
MECTPHRPLLFASASHLAHGRMCLLLGYEPYIFSFLLVSALLTSDYNILGLRIEEESPDSAL